MSRASRLFLLLLFLLCINAQAQTPAPMLLGRVAVNRTHVAFNYAGDIWLVERAGGEAQRLDVEPGANNFPVFSPDGSQLAFAKQNGPAWDVYVRPAGGAGETRRLTFHPGTEFPVGWTPDGARILFASNRTGFQRVYALQPGGSPLPVELPLPKASGGSVSPDGRRIAYSPMATNVGDWRFYRGGSKGMIWLVNLGDGALERLPSGDYNDLMPMWVGQKIYFISDRTGTYNLFSYDLSNRQTKQLSTFEKYGIRWASAGPDVIAFVRDGRIHLYDIASNQTRILDVRVKPDTTEMQPRTVNASRTIEWVMPSADGERLAFTARGEVLLFDPLSGEARNLSQSAAAERFATISPDGKQVAYFSDESGEYRLHVRQIEGAGGVRKIAIEPKPSFYRELTWSPDSKKLAFADKRLALWYADVEAGTARRVDTSVYSYQEELRPAWSPDSRYLTYSKHLHNRVRTVYIFDLPAGKTHQVTDGRTHTESPVFDASGKYLYFFSSPNAGTSEFGWGVLSGVLARSLVVRRAHLIVLQSDQPSPLLPNGQPDPAVKLESSAASPRIDFEGIATRVVDLPLQPRDYAQLVSGGQPGQLFVLVYEWPKSASLGSNPAQTLYVYDLAKPQKFDKLVEEIGGFEISRDGKRLLYAKERNWFLVSTKEPPKPDEGKLDLKRLEVKVDPRLEWTQMYREAWRIMRDWFYDPNHHGQNISELERHYAEYLPSITRRSDLNGLMNMMLGHVSVSHLGVGGGDQPQQGPSQRVGLLGADYEIEGNRYRFKRVLRSTQYNSPSGSVVAPLDRPGVVVRDGEYLLEVEGQPVETSKSVYSYFEGKVNQPTKIKVGRTVEGEGARILTVFPVPDESPLRRANWAEENRRRVEQLSGGKLGYIYVANYGSATVDMIRGLVGYGDRPGIVIDQRYNGGGITPDYLIEWLRRRPLYYYMFREGDDIATPTNPGPNTKVLIVNENNFSAAETFAFMYKLARVGPIVGTRTGGGGIGPYVYTPNLVDGGSVQLPNRAAYNPDGTTFGIENVGITPDYEVEVTPRDLLAGRDPQIEKAVQVALAEVAKNPIVAPKRPRYPIHK